jgi:hypothetical protein
MSKSEKAKGKAPEMVPMEAVKSLLESVEAMKAQNKELSKRIEAQEITMSQMSGKDRFLDKGGAINEPSKEVAAFNEKNGASDTMLGIVYEVLGVDFKVKYDGLGSMLHLIVPARMQELPNVTVNKLDEYGEVVLDPVTGAPVKMPIATEDVRSRQVSTVEEVESWCNLVKENIVKNYRDRHVAPPEFNIKYKD